MRVGPSGLPPRGVVDGLALGQRRAGAGDEGEVLVILRAVGLAEEEPGRRRQGSGADGVFQRVPTAPATAHRYRTGPIGLTARTGQTCGLIDQTCGLRDRQAGPSVRKPARTVQPVRNTSADPAYTFNAVQQAMALKLALDLARIFDVTENGRYPAEEQDKASIPVLAALAINGTDIDPQVWIDRDRDRTLRFCRCLSERSRLRRSNWVSVSQK
jgi:hypothetical protein